MAERIITLVRHGKHDRKSTLHGGGDLLPKGKQQAKDVANVISRQFPVTHIYTSTMRRAMSTAYIISDHLPGIPVTEDKTLCEAVFHIPKHSEDYFNQQYQNISASTVAAHRVRMAHAYKTYVRPAIGHEDQHDVLVCHGNVIRYFIIRAMHAPMDLWTQMEIYNGSITRLLVDQDGSTRLVTHNEVSHLHRRLWTKA